MMKNKKFLFLILALCAFHFSFFSDLSGQEIIYNDAVDDEQLSRKETQAQKKATAETADPFYEKHIKNQWETRQEEKAQKLIEELKKEYGTDKFNRDVLDRGPKTDKKDGPAPGDMKSDDSYYEENIKSSWKARERETKKEVLDWLKTEIEGEQGKAQPSQTTTKDSSGPPSADPYFEDEVSKTWQRDKKDLIERIRNKLKEDKAYITVEEEKKAKKEEGEEKGKDEKKQEEPQGNSFWFFFSNPLAKYL